MGELASSDIPSLRAQGIMGLAELSPDGKPTLSLLAEVRDPGEQSLLVIQSLGAGRLTPDQVESILSWPRLEPRLEAGLRLHLACAGLPADRDRLGELAKSDLPLAALLAEAALSAAGDEKATARAVARLGSLSESQREGTLAPLAETLLREAPQGTAPLAAALVDAGVTPRDRASALKALLRLAPARGVSVWLTEWERAAELPDRLRLGMVALEAAPDSDRTLLDTLAKSGDETLGAMGRAGAAVSRSATDADGALLALVKLSHDPSATWALGRAATLPPAVASRFYRDIIAWAASTREPGDEVPRLVFDAASRLATLDASLLAAPLSSACHAKDGPLAEAILAAALRTGMRPVWDPAGPPEFPGRASQAMATIYEARLSGLKPDGAAGESGPLSAGGGFPADPEKAERLRQIALGWGNLPDAYRTIAAWLALCQDGKDREVLTRLFAPEPLSPSQQ